MIDIYRSRRGSNLECFYWKRDNTSESDEIIMKSKPSGFFYAKFISEKEKGKQDFANSFRVEFEGTQIQTEDKIDLAKDDIVVFNNKKWIVTRIGERIVQKNSEFSIDESKITTIGIQKGE